VETIGKVYRNPDTGIACRCRCSAHLEAFVCGQIGICAADQWPATPACRIGGSPGV